ncbi:MAG: sensor histidine kinase [Leptospirillum sp.]
MMNPPEAIRPSENQFDPDPLPAPATQKILYLAGALFLFIFLADALTPQSLVVSILLDIPIALTGLTLRKRATVSIVILGLVANTIAGIINAKTEGSLDSIALLNRIFSAVSFFLVGYLTLKIQENAHETGIVFSERNRATREHKIRTFLAGISAQNSPDTLLSELAGHLQSLLGAKGVVIAASEQDQWRSTTYSAPDGLWFWKSGESIPGGLSLLGKKPFLPTWISKPSLSALLENNNVSQGVVARLSLPPIDQGAGQFIYLFILEPEEPAILSILAEITPILEEVIARVRLLQHLREYNQILLRRNSIIHDLIYGVSHDIRTPLIANTINMKLALEGAYGNLPDEFSSILEKTIVSNNSILELSNSLLLLSRFELNDLSLLFEPQRLDHLLNDLLSDLSPLLQSKSIHLLTDLKELILSGDRQSLRRLFQNLVDNAIKWSPEGGTLKIVSDKDLTRITVDIIDEGPGIPEPMRSSLFTRFGGIHPGSGFGLGLYIAQQIARRHNGLIEYHPEHPGSRFRIIFKTQENPL